MDSVNDPPESQIFSIAREAEAGRSFDIRHNFVANAAYELPGSGRLLGGWRIAAVAGRFIPVPHLPRCSPSTMPMCNGC